MTVMCVNVCMSCTYLWSEFHVQLNFRLQLFVDGRVMRLTPYRSVVVFHFRNKFQHGPGRKPSAVRCCSFYVRFDAIFDHSTRIVSPSDLCVHNITKRNDEIKVSQ